ncbi:hypothetical protein EV659_102205 [Rhodothalassium salexigens DSM 2132]|uniref:Uncharacterized protein n=1 Tax=Rhodothalassium salexigens DSM 2132 TaxID=1188247 RepID=A0A4R2PS76_RHOSA|nr:hypothetical protein [Rhodothalassium salexigens]MBB4210646.1 hypothetical protein [Rhodothalassium salexigens DSM 2132]MBK1639967.1 hypothetical protein [Rhodothalassium salexigens DSM 2132]TCP37798.1 hypothetical protein EV659_102205 [Rhodothalassium salexigens DSM 2132]
MNVTSATTPTGGATSAPSKVPAPQAVTSSTGAPPAGMAERAPQTAPPKPASPVKAPVKAPTTPSRDGGQQVARQGGASARPAPSAAPAPTASASFARQALEAYGRAVQAQEPQAGRRLFQPQAGGFGARVSQASMTQPARTQAAAQAQRGTGQPPAATPANTIAGGAGGRAILINTSPQNPQGPFAQVILAQAGANAATGAAGRGVEMAAGVRTYQGNAGTVARYASGQTGFATRTNLAA